MGHTSATDVIPLGIPNDWDGTHICPNNVSIDIRISSNNKTIECWGDIYTGGKSNEGQLMVNLTSPDIIERISTIHQSWQQMAACHDDLPCVDQATPCCLLVTNEVKVCVSERWMAKLTKAIYWVETLPLKLSLGEIVLATVLPVVGSMLILLGITRWWQLRKKKLGAGVKV